jgi:hypothetical protein
VLHQVLHQGKIHLYRTRRAVAYIGGGKRFIGSGDGTVLIPLLYVKCGTLLRVSHSGRAGQCWRGTVTVPTPMPDTLTVVLERHIPPRG